MNGKERFVYTILKYDPDVVHITPQGDKMYALVPGGLACFMGPDFNAMNQAEINNFLEKVREDLVKPRRLFDN